MSSDKVLERFLLAVVVRGKVKLRDRPPECRSPGAIRSLQSRRSALLGQRVARPACRSVRGEGGMPKAILVATLASAI